MALNRAERLQLEAAQEKINWLWNDTEKSKTLSSSQRTALSFVAARIEKVLTGHAAYR